MSDDYIKLIPTDPCYIPAKPLQKKAIRLLEQMLPEGEECEAEVYERLTFIDQGENCPSSFVQAVTVNSIFTMMRLSKSGGIL